MLQLVTSSLWSKPHRPPHGQHSSITDDLLCQPSPDWFSAHLYWGGLHSAGEDLINCSCCPFLLRVNLSLADHQLLRWYKTQTHQTFSVWFSTRSIPNSKTDCVLPPTFCFLVLTCYLPLVLWYEEAAKQEICRTTNAPIRSSACEAPSCFRWKIAERQHSRGWCLSVDLFEAEV